MRAAIPRLHVPMLQPEDLIPHLGKREHWNVERSAYALCKTWWQANSVPPAVRLVLQTQPELAELGLVDGFFERQVELGDGRRPSQTDLMAICADQHGLGVLAVEGKGDEPFGPRVDEWLNDLKLGGDQRQSLKKPRLGRLCNRLGLELSTVAQLRYQLLHRAASALIEAERYHASRAVLIVHSFSPKRTGFTDFSQFATVLGLPAADVNRVVGPLTLNGVALFLGWAADCLPATATSTSAEAP